MPRASGSSRSVRESLLDPPPPPPRAGGGAPYTGREAALALAQGKAGGSDGAVPLSAAEAFLTSAQASPLQLLLDYTPPSYKPTRGGCSGRNSCLARVRVL
jgi:hypothetical protein